MAGLKEIDRRRKSVANTRKITYAMKLVSAAKLKKAQDAVSKSRQYTDALYGLLAKIGGEMGGADLKHPLMETRPSVKKVLLIVAGGNRGLCGGYNTNLNKKVEAFNKEKSAASISVDTIILGKKPAEYYRRVRREYIKSYEALSEDANLWPVEEVCREAENGFLTAGYDEVYLIYTKFKSALSSTPVVEKLLPVDPTALAALGGAGTQAASAGQTLFEPSAIAVFSALVPRLVRSQLRQGCLDTKASEHGSRMTAMDAATRNAKELIHKLNLTFNRLRQSGITAELLDIIGGAEAQN
ncbi:MAG: ATP synthase F1 subunit gamma [Oligoflexia bacterium]|nr:ATP synthase F1 subunit gamma [Oligoflexia bacterium]